MQNYSLCLKSYVLFSQNTFYPFCKKVYCMKSVFSRKLPVWIWNLTTVTKKNILAMTENISGNNEKPQPDGVGKG